MKDRIDEMDFKILSLLADNAQKGGYFPRHCTCPDKENDKFGADKGGNPKSGLQQDWMENDHFSRSLST